MRGSARGSGGGGQSGEEGELLAGEEAQLEPAEDVIHDGLGVADVLVAGPAGGLKARVRELLAQDFERHSVLQRERDGGGEGVHEAGDGGAFLGHLDEDFARLPVGVKADGDVALVSGDAEFVGKRRTLFRQAMTDGSGRCIRSPARWRPGLVAMVASAAEKALVASTTDLAVISSFSETLASSVLTSASGAVLPVRNGGEDAIGGCGYGVVSVLLGALDDLGFLAVGDVERLRALGSVAVDGDGLEAQTPGLGVGLGDVFDGRSRAAG